MNGLQTSNEIYNYFSAVPSEELENDGREVLLRIIAPQSEGSRDKIIKATNNQTKIPPTALKATDPVHRDIEQYLKPKGLYYDRRKNYYRNDGKPKAQIISITELAQAMIAIKLARPDDARARPSTVFSDDDSYLKIFSHEIPLELYYAVLQIMKSVEQHMNGTTLTTNERTNMRYYVAHYVTCLSCSKVNPGTDDILSAPGLITRELLDEAIVTVKEFYRKAGGDDNAAKGTRLLEIVERSLRGAFVLPSDKRNSVTKKGGVKSSAKTTVIKRTSKKTKL